MRGKFVLISRVTRYADDDALDEGALTASSSNHWRSGQFVLVAARCRQPQHMCIGLLEPQMWIFMNACSVETLQFH